MTILPEFLTGSSQRYEPPSATEAEQRMWGAVIVRAIADAVWVDSNPTGNLNEKINFGCTIIRRRSANRLRDEAVFWLTMDNRSFREKCSWAGVEPEKVRRWAMRAMESSHEDKARLAAQADLSLHDLREAGELRAGSEPAA